MKNAIPLAGRRFGRWTVNRRAANASNRRPARYGAEKLISQRVAA